MLVRRTARIRGKMATGCRGCGTRASHSLPLRRWAHEPLERGLVLCSLPRRDSRRLLTVEGDAERGLVWRTRAEGMAQTVRASLERARSLPEVRVPEIKESGCPDSERIEDDVVAFREGLAKHQSAAGSSQRCGASA
jgi:hypothetical protein